MESLPLKACVRCGEPRILAPECPRCGVLYAKAQARAPRPEAPPEPSREAPVVPDPYALLQAHARAEARRGAWRGRLGAMGLLALVWGLDSAGWAQLPLHVLAMFLHELGHAVTAWFCGSPSMPGLWVTHSAPRSTFFFSLGALVLMGLVFRGVLLRSRPILALGLGGLALQFVGSVLLTATQARAAISFGGDGGALVFGALGLLSFHAPEDSRLRQGQLHWGFGFIGAAALVTTFREWWAARTDFARIPFGDIEGVGLSDASALVDVHGWSELALIHRYNALGLGCLAALALVNAWSVWRERRG